jgi:DNA-binding Xre family transcriptional regulator
MSDFVTLANSLIKLAKEKGASKEELQKILKEKTKGIFFSPLASREHMMI